MRKKITQLIIFSALLTACGTVNQTRLSPSVSANDLNASSVASDKAPFKVNFYFEPIPLPWYPLSFPDRLLFTGNNEIFAMKPDGSQRQTLYALSSDEVYQKTISDPVWNAQKNRVAFFKKNRMQSDKDIELMILDLRYPYPKVISLINDPNIKMLVNSARLQWSPDGNWLAFLGEVNQNKYIYVTKTDGSMLQTTGSQARRLSNTHGILQNTSGADDKSSNSFQWANDNFHIYFTKSPSSVDGLYRINLGNSAPEFILDSINNYFSLSPDNTQVVFRRLGDLYTYHLTKKVLRKRVSHTEQPNGVPPHSPQWSPDSQKIAFITTIEDNRDTDDGRMDEVYVHNTLTHLNQKLTISPIQGIWDYMWSDNSQEIAASDTAQFIDLSQGGSGTVPARELCFNWIFSMNAYPRLIEGNRCSLLPRLEDWSKY